jgi:hypothetical protein
VKIAEFLLARVAETEATATAVDADRELAECEARRQIIERASRNAETGLLKFLAHRYADHPDYDPGWKQP